PGSTRYRRVARRAACSHRASDDCRVARTAEYAPGASGKAGRPNARSGANGLVAMSRPGRPLNVPLWLDPAVRRITPSMTGGTELSQATPAGLASDPSRAAPARTPRWRARPSDRPDADRQSADRRADHRRSNLLEP